MAMFIIHPLMIGPQGYANITQTKLSTFKIILVISVVLLLLAVLVSRVTVKGYRFFPGGFKACVRGGAPYEWALIAFWVLLAAATLLSDNPGAALYGTTPRNEGLFVWTGYAAVFFMVSRFYRPDIRDVTVFCLFAALIAIYGFLQYLGHDLMRLLPPGYEYMLGPNLSHVATMSNIDVFSTYMCLAFCLSFVCFAKASKKWHWVFLPLGLIAFFSILLGDVLSGYVGLLFAFAAAFPFVASDRQSTGRSLLMLGFCAVLPLVKLLVLNTAAHWKAWQPGELEGLLPAIERQQAPLKAISPYLPPVVAVLLVLSVLFMFSKLPGLPAKIWRICWYSLVVLVIAAGLVTLPVVAERTDNETVREANALLHGELLDSFGTDRGYTWKKAFALFKERPLFGFGPDGFFPAFDARFGEESVARNGVTYDKVHNEFLQVLVDSGIFALLALLAFYALVLWKARRIITASPIGLAAAFALLCYLAQAFFNIATPFANPLVWVFWGILGAEIRINPRPAGHPLYTPRGTGRKGARGRTYRIIRIITNCGSCECHRNGGVLLLYPFRTLLEEYNLQCCED
jgi:O-antigen ligase